MFRPHLQGSRRRNLVPVVTLKMTESPWTGNHSTSDKIFLTSYLFPWLIDNDLWLELESVCPVQPTHSSLGTNGSISFIFLLEHIGHALSVNSFFSSDAV